ncbi:Long-chain-fatty-acid--CoA ligase FadD19 [Nocardia otitidiscaviarum]|uniref:Long-chain-fatty-acid--CoA ligase FadD19 n=2 Tax=Nocardia TaxID=1817 RepID=A0A378YG36_9NOCA|nr:acyl-CoA synthetase [Nocardia otitidiscaviarum]SUA75359.1 Long-chain-fatty-acid--CoA ligase FadD19 [Nocardia otitidiscaviarum]
MACNFADLYEHSVDAMPDRVAVIQGDRRRTFDELEQRANRLAHHLAAAGAGPGTHIGFLMHNSVETLETLIACFKIRAVPININYRYRADELRYVFDNADLEMVVHHRCYAPLVEEVRPQVPSLRHALVVEDDQGGAGAASNSVPYEQALENGSPARDFGPRSPDDLFLMYTGGTTGLPKGVMWRQEDMWRVLGGGIDFYTGEPVADEYQQSRTGASGDQATWFILPPLIHAAAMMPTFTALWSGNAVIFEPRFDPARVWRVVARERPQVLVITGDAMARPLLDAYRSEPTDVSALWVIASGAALLSQSVKNELLTTFPSKMVSDSIGSSETGFGGIGFAQRDDDPTRGPRVNVGRGAVVVDDDGRPVAPGGEGWVAKTGNVPIGYYKDPAKTDKLFRTVDGVRMVITDDRAKVEQDGSVTLLGRGNMVVNSGGEKVFAEEVEAIVKAHESVYDAIVIGVPHERWGQQVAAVVSTADGAVDFPALERHVRAHLAGYKLPRRIWVAELVVRTPSGKPDYRWAKDYAASHAPDYEVVSR